MDNTARLALTWDLLGGILHEARNSLIAASHQLGVAAREVQEHKRGREAVAAAQALCDHTYERLSNLSVMWRSATSQSPQATMRNVPASEL